MKKNKIIEYDYIVHNISGAYKAIIPSFNGVVFGESLEEIENGVIFSIEEEIKRRKKHNIPIPNPDKESKYSGKLVLRIDPYLHERLAMEAKSKRKSLNKYIKEKMFSN
ncbi:type II toxin-antitoxin system HicB family antitoxin [Patescibacteria group bacterium]|nr:type II toxin-antitoxin system HicB family antitoxin [Patescibacteria group bacterium]MCG2694557.1 type II toxin-antitoxin system HicB family antitoxin [Candidatus Parcubacteria bacterium]